MPIIDIVARAVRIAEPDHGLHHAAATMAQADCGVLSVSARGRLIGMVTDREIAVRGTATEKSSDRCMAREVMSARADYVFEDDDIEHVVRHMASRDI